MLCESLMLLLVEAGVIRKDLLVGAVENAVNVGQETAGTSESVVVSKTSIGLLRRIVSSLLALPPPPIDGAAGRAPE